MLFVCPGDAETIARFEFAIRFISDDLPTLERPMNAISGLANRGKAEDSNALHLNVNVPGN